MKMTGSRRIEAPVGQVWTALNDPAVIKQCVAGCESMELTGENAYKMVVAQQVGPVSARFSGTMRVLDAQPPASYTLQFEGNGAAGFARGGARVSLVADGANATTLAYEADAQIGGKLAQVGSRLIDAVAARLTDDFFARFGEVVAPQLVPTGENVPAPADMRARQGAARRLAIYLGLALIALVALAVLARS